MGYKTFQGTPVEYVQLHQWVTKKLGKPSLCSSCGRTDARKFEWANISGEYKKVLTDWKRLCTSCHVLMDNKNMCKRGHELTPENSYLWPKSGPHAGERACRTCRNNNNRAYALKVKQEKL